MASGGPNDAKNLHFTASSSTAEDLLKNQTVGLVQLSDFRKRRAEVLDQRDRDAQNNSLSRTGTPDPASTDVPRNSASPRPGNRKKKTVKEKLSFGMQDVDDDFDSTSMLGTPGPVAPLNEHENTTESVSKDVARSRLGPNRSLSRVPRAMTKSALLKEAQIREQLRKDFLILQEKVKATEVLIPFVFYDGTNVPGGTCKMKKGDHVWLFLDKARKIGAGGASSGDRSRREWARIGVDDLMLVRGEIIIPHHHDFYYFLINKIHGPAGLVFNYSSEPTKHTPNALAVDGSNSKSYNPLTRPGAANKGELVNVPDLEGFNDDPTLTKVVDRRWYERSKHIYPASVWEEFDPSKDYSDGFRKDTKGNTFFFS